MKYSLPTRTAAAISAGAALAMTGLACGEQVTAESSPAPSFPRAEPPVASATVAPRHAVAEQVVHARPQPSCGSASRPLRTRSLAFAAVVRTEEARAYATPGGELLRRFGRLNANGVPTAFGVLSRIRCAGEWLRVQLPVRPNGLVGWVRARDVELVRVQTRIAVDLSERRVTLYRRGREVLRVAAAIGAADTPTPTGSYYVNQRLIAPNPEGPFGPAALGISAFSPVLKNWIQGGPIAIHGTNRPDLTGRAASHGCIRVRNPMLVRLFRAAAVGTPVVIRL